MNRSSQSKDYRNPYSYIPRSRSIPARNNYRQFYDSRTYNTQLLYPYTTATTTTTNVPFSSSYLQEQPLTTIADLPEPMSLFDELGYIRSRRANATPFPPVYVPSNRRTPSNVTRFTTANALRERLLVDIQHNINEIDHELALLDRRPVMPLYIPISFSTFKHKLPSSHHENRIRSIEPKRVYKVIPRIPGPTKKISSHSTPTRVKHIVSPAFVGQYHYAPEMEENEIRENDPENTDQNSIVKEIPQIDFHKPLTLDEVRPKKSTVPDNRALIIVPAIAGNDEPEVIKPVEKPEVIKPIEKPEVIKPVEKPEIIKPVEKPEVIKPVEKPEVIKKVDEAQQTNLVNELTSSSTSLKVSQEFSSTSKLNFRNFEPLVQNSLEQNKSTDNRISDSAINPMISKPVKHTSSSTQIHTDAEKPISPTRRKIFKSISSDNDIDENANHLPKDGTNGSIHPDTHISVFPESRAPQTEFELKSDYIIENDTNGRSKSKYVITDTYTSPLSITTAGTN